MPENRLLPPSLRSKYVCFVETGRIVEVNAGTIQSIPTLSALGYLEYCRVCYEAAFDPTSSRAPASLYRAFADGRHGGLLTLPGACAGAFREWYEGRKFHGSHPFEIVRDSIVLSVHATQDNGFCLRLRARRHDFVTPWLIAMAVGLVEAGVPFEMLNVRQHLLFATGTDWIGVADDKTWLRGSPVWPEGSGILNTIQNSFSTSELKLYHDAFHRIRWFGSPVRVRVQ